MLTTGIYKPKEQQLRSWIDLESFIIPYRVKFFKKINDYLTESQHHTLKQSLKHCGERVHFLPALSHLLSGSLEIGDDSTIGTYVHMWCLGGIAIGSRVMIGSHTAITSITHDYAEEDMRFAPTIRKPVVVEDDVWIGTHSIILPGVTIGKGSVVGANSVVTKDVKPYSIVYGSPAKIYKYREQQLPHQTGKDSDST
jgi:acetyltransferase-like isoleucine patch superfamily enzyme